MTAIGRHIPRADRQYATRQGLTELIDQTGYPISLDQLIARQRDYRAQVASERAECIRDRAAAEREAIAEQADGTEAIRTARRKDAQLRREQQRKARISAGTDRATIRAHRAATAALARPGRIESLNRYFGR